MTPIRTLSHVSTFASVMLAACTSEGQRASGPAEVVAELELVLGEAGDSVIFGDARDVAVDAAGRIYVTDGQAASVRVFDSTGQFVRALGRLGDGPGEFDVPQGVEFGPNGNAYAYDGDGARINVFDTSGAVVLSHRIPVSSYGFVWRGGIDSSGRIVDQQVFRRDTTAIWVVRVMNLDASTIDTFDLPPCRFEPEPYYEFPRGSAQVPFAAGAASWIDVASGSVWCAHSGRPAAYRYAFGATTAIDSLVSWATPARVTPEERAEQVERLERFAQQAGGTGIDATLIPEAKEVLLGLKRDPEGRVWMTINDSAGAAAHVFSTEGEWIARVRFPDPVSAFASLAWHANHVYAVGEDADGAPVVRRYLVELP
ncbi:MAG TPA: 6-bladed beta-propeller [Gemmatimonadales bacterium]|nr:6-bladed beta-propeller [Gemmatimonadales bacterium]